MAQGEKSVDSPHTPNQNILAQRNIKKGRSLTPCTCARNPLTFELKDSADALVDLLLK